ncbi:MAG TPA: pyridoxal phosphate-dependent aminotransferase [Bryobacteraceae bacterium]|nr:pyridoxal phosphate-dependent aminotransferase [Bryobacteraceae bacterium]
MGLRFSNRLPWDAPATTLSRAIQAHGDPEADLTISNPTAVGFSYPEIVIRDALASAETLRYMPDSRGLQRAREAISEYHRNAVSSDEVVLTASTSEGYSWIFKLLCQAGDEILVPTPAYPLFECLAGLEGVHVRSYAMHYYDGWYIDTDRLGQLPTERTRAIVFVNPGNPTGSFLGLSEYETMARLCHATNMALICDEVFADYPFQPLSADFVPSVAGRADVLTFVLSGLSKVCALPQMKLGWIAVKGPREECDAALSRLDLIADTYLSVSTPVQHAAAQLLDVRRPMQQQVLERVRANYRTLLSMTEGTGLRPLHVQGGWTAAVRVPPVRSEEDWVLHLLGHSGVLTQPGYFYDFQGGPFLVLSLLTPLQTFSEGLRRTILACKG